MKKINPHILQWAMDWNGLTTNDLAKAFPKINQWLDGTHEPTFKQLEKFAIKTHTLVPYFFMQTVPDVRLQIADFRKTNPDDKEVPSPELFDTIDELLYKQAWLRDYFTDEGADKLDWVGHFANNDPRPSVTEIAEYLHSLLGLSKGWASEGDVNSIDAAWRALRQAIERQRVAVCISGYAGFADTTPDADVINKYAEVSKWVFDNPQFLDSAKREFLQVDAADPFLL